MELSNKEFYRTPNGEIMVHDESGSHTLTERDRNFISAFITKMGEFWPEALQVSSKLYEKARHSIPLFEFKIVRRFLKCNFGRFDNTLDIDQMGNYHFEDVECPLRGECPFECKICKPKFNSALSEREIEVMRCLYDGMNIDQISDKLYISPDTIRTHKRNALQRTGTHSLQEFFIYARDKNLFNQ